VRFDLILVLTLFWINNLLVLRLMHQNFIVTPISGLLIHYLSNGYFIHHFNFELNSQIIVIQSHFSIAFIFTDLLIKWICVILLEVSPSRTLLFPIVERAIKVVIKRKKHLSYIQTWFPTWAPVYLQLNKN